jgi:hypothetical protein
MLYHELFLDVELNDVMDDNDNNSQKPTNMEGDKEPYTYFYRYWGTLGGWEIEALYNDGNSNSGSIGIVGFERDHV